MAISRETDPIDAAIKQEQIRILYLGLPATLAVAALIAVLLVTLEWPRFPHDRLLLWLTGFLLVIFLRIGLLLAWRRAVAQAPGVRSTVDWLNWYRLGVLMTAVGWGPGGYWLFSIADVSQQIWLTMVLLGVSSAGSASHSVDRVSALLIACVPILPVMVLMALKPEVSILLPVMGVLYLIYTYASTGRMQTNQLDNIRLRQQTADYTEALRVNEERWNLALESAGEGVLDWDVGSGQVLYSRSWKQLLGYSDTAVGSSLSDWHDRMHPDDRARALAEWQAHLDNTLTDYHSEQRMRCQDGSYTWCLCHGQVVGRDAAGKPLRFIGILTDISKLKFAEKMQESLRAISEASQSAESLAELFRRIHQVIGELLPAKNFFVALYNEQTEEMSFPYFIDEFDPPPEARKLDEHTLSARVIRSRQALLLTPETDVSGDQVSSSIVGSDSLDWLGVPMLLQGRVIGVLVVQSYSGDVRYTERDKQLLQFVSTQTAVAIERKQVQEKLNHERHIQNALRDISEAAQASENLQDMFAKIHGIVGSLLPAKNLFVALYDHENDILSFPYFVDEHDAPPGPRKLGEGTLSARVIRSGEALLLTRDQSKNILDPGTVLVGSAFLDWLGVPLISQKRTIGVLVVQSYGGNIRYSEKDRDLLKFVSTQVATAIERKQSDERIRHLAQHDVLTDLPNRALFNDRLQVAITRNARYKEHLALMYLDLDKFKPINDTYGHAVGDLLLKEAADRIRQSVRDSDTVGRIGGDEFLVLLHTVSSAEAATIVAEKIRSALAKPFSILGHELAISGSIGVAIYPENGGDQKSLAACADAAMYRAKHEGGNRYVIVDGTKVADGCFSDNETVDADRVDGAAPAETRNV
ncbi:diguanylate cyclase [Permianibacter sp. IMCC34836]|uniref:sensor domain-containing diguanylate cyclase n=1 Tax=Permianibacter fluminis TaxID=2738515 RepID=UPI001553B1DA|nr:sensor domain-containing diguanylate cyclase [Permianibacter fluminis]NQD37851.1 diguanylate cyclase [Permianibacter fluminis]